MRGRPVLVQAAVAVGALALAAAVWLRPPRQGAPGEVPLAALGRGEVKAVHWDDGSHQVDVTRVVDADRRAVWVRIATSPTLQAPDGGAGADGGVGLDAGLVPPRADAGVRGRSDAGVRGRADAGVSDALRAIREAPPPPPRELLGNDVAEQLLDRVSPPMATRDLGPVTPERKRALGLEASSKRLRLETGRDLSSQARMLDFVVSTPPGAAGAYLLAPDGHLWLVQEALVQDLSAASSRLVDRRLHAFRVDEPDALQIQLDGRARALSSARRRERPASLPRRTPTPRARRPLRGRTACGGSCRWRCWAVARRPARARPPSRSGWSTAGTAVRWATSRSLAPGPSGTPAPSTPPAGCGSLRDSPR